MTSPEEDYIRDEGKKNGIIELIRKKLKKGKSIDQIADELETTPEQIQRLIKEIKKE